MAISQRSNDYTVRGYTPEKYRNKYPIYIVSKDRADTRYTAKALDLLGIDYFVAVEPQDVEAYEKTHAGTRGTILELPFSNHGLGPGPARNWCWEHSRARGDRRHWVMDDNIFEFWRFYENSRIKFTTGSFFRAWEDFNDRFINVPMSGLQYKFFVMDDYDYKPVLFNTRLMSCMLIENSWPHQWRGKYNEDVDISLRVVKEGACTALSYTFLCGKARTQTVKGGNHKEFYEKEGTYKKSKMLVDMHPDCCELVYRYGRWHHIADFSKWAGNRPIVDPNVTWNLEPNEYGMTLATDYNSETGKYTHVIAAKDIEENPRFTFANEHNMK